MVPDTVPEAPVEEVEVPVTEVKQDVVDTLVDDFVVTESVTAVEIAIAESAEPAAVQQELVASDAVVVTPTESVDVTPTEPEPAPPAEEIILDATAEQKCPAVLSEEPKSEICDMPCQIQQLAVESAVQLSSMEMSVETALNGHMVPEVSIEG